MRVLLTGSSGRLGRHLAPLLERAGHQAIGLDVNTGEHTQVLASVADRVAVERTFALHAPQTVIDAAALHKPDIAHYPRRAFVDVNVGSTLNLLDCAVAGGCDRFLFTSTTSLMISRASREGGAGEEAWIDETLAPLEPRNIYAVRRAGLELPGLDRPRVRRVARRAPPRLARPHRLRLDPRRAPSR